MERSALRGCAVGAVMLASGGAAFGGGGSGADAIIGDITQATLLGQSNGVVAYSFGFATCNVGSSQITVNAVTNNHPVWAQNLYRLQDGLFQQIGMSHMHHGFFSLEQNLCGPCSPVGGGNLGPGCSDVSSASITGQQVSLGPRTQVNPTTGVFAFPFVSPPAEATIGRRLQVAAADVDPAMNPGATYWAEIHVVTPEDAAAGHGHNNVSSREVQFAANLAPTFAAPADRAVSALDAWAMLDGEVFVSPLETDEGERFAVASRAYDNGDGTWLYVYAIHNISSDRGARAFQFDLGSGAVSDPGFHSPSYHSGDGAGGQTIPNTAWAFSFVDEKARWESETFAENENANALRWGTVYTFWFTSVREPRVFDAQLTLFRPTAGDPDANDQLTVSVVKPRSCVADFDDGGTVNFADVNQLLSQFGQTGGDLSVDTNGDGVVDFADLNVALSEFGRNDCY